MKFTKNVLSLFVVMLLTSCAMTQPRAPLYDGLKPVSKEEIKQQEEPKYQLIKETETYDYDVYHIVEDGDYVWALGRKYDISPFTIIKQNKLKKPTYTLTKGQKLFIKTEKRKRVVTKKVLVKVSQSIPAKDNTGYSLTRNPKLYNQNTAEFRKIQSIPRQDLSKSNKDKNIDFGYHKVVRGENLFRIGKKYGVSVFDLMAYNDLDSPQSLQAGQELKIPVAKKELSQQEEQEEILEQEEKPSTTLNIEKIDQNLAKKKGFIYPVKGRIISKYGNNGHGIRNDGIDIAVKLGTPIRASQSGTVRYAEGVSTLGNMILIKHKSGYISAYTHNSKLLVKKGDKVVKGQVIALSGDSGNAKQPMLHFELRRYGKALNPVKILK